MSGHMFDPQAARMAKQDGMARVHQAASEAWKVSWMEATLAVAYRQAEFTMDDIIREHAMRGGPVTHENRARGPMMLNAMREGVCVPVDAHKPSAQRVCHGRLMRTWRSLVYRKGERV